MADRDDEKTGALPAEVQRVADALLARVIDGSYPAGLRLPSEPAIAEELGCGRSTVREALRHLAGLGVVRSRQGSGAAVLDFRREGTPALLTHYLAVGRFDHPAPVMARELLGLRSLLATEAVRLAARYARPEDLRPVLAILDEAKRLAADPVAHARSELSFFRALVHASRVWPAVWLANSFWGPMHEVLELLGPFVAKVRPDHQPRMRKLVALIEAQDEARAVAHVTAWLADVDRMLAESVERAFPSEAPATHAPARAKAGTRARTKAATRAPTPKPARAPRPARTPATKPARKPTRTRPEAKR